MTDPIELHGFRMCPFAWRTRLAAHEKGIPFDWLPHDADAPDPRVAAHNPEKRSPLLWHQGFSLRESSIISQYLDEAFEGPPLQPSDPKARAQMRFAMVDLGGLKFDGRVELTGEARARVEAGLRNLEGRLDPGPWLGGERPSLVDFELWPWFPLMVAKGALAAEQLDALPRVARYWGALQQRESFRETNPRRVPPG